VLGEAKHEHYRVRWETDRESVFYPSSDSTIQHAKRERRERSQEGRFKRQEVRGEAPRSSKAVRLGPFRSCCSACAEEVASWCTLLILARPTRRDGRCRNRRQLDVDPPASSTTSHLHVGHVVGGGLGSLIDLML